MPTLEEKILLYALLSPEEKQGVKQEVANHPELLALFDEARAFDALLEDARLLWAQPTHDEALAYYAATLHLHPHTPSEALRPAFERIEARLQEDAALHKRYTYFRQRIEEAEAALDPLALFERLTGLPHTAPPPAQESLSQNGQGPADSMPQQPRPAHARVWILSSWMKAALFAGVVVGGVWIFSQTTASPLDQRVATEAAQFDAEPLRFRSPPSPDTFLGAAEREALDLLRDAHTTTFGLFPRYDGRGLEQAELLLERQLAPTDPPAAPSPAARYLLGLVRLAQHDAPGARDIFQGLAATEGPYAAQARRLLDALAQHETP